MSAAPKLHSRPIEIRAATPLETALLAIDAGLWPVVITAWNDRTSKSPGKAPIGTSWGARRPDADSIRASFKRTPKANVGLKLGAEGMVVDVDVDDPEQARPVLSRLFPQGLPSTLRWSNADGRFHLLFAYDDRLAAIGKTIVKGQLKADSKVIGNPMYLGLEIRIGAAPGSPKQIQSVIPPSLMANGAPRKWVESGQLLALPDSVIADLEANAGSNAKPPLSIFPGMTAKDNRPSAEVRASLYLAKCEAAIQGQDGSGRCFKAACKMVEFGLTEEAALRLLMAEYNPRCEPKWTEAEMRHKVQDAFRENADRTGIKLKESQNGYHSNNGEASTPPPDNNGTATDEEPPSRLVPIEAEDDPHRLARVHRDQKCMRSDGLALGLALRYWRGRWLLWDGSAYQESSDTEVKAGLVNTTKAEFDRLNIQAQIEHARRKEESRGKKGRPPGDPPTATKVTTALASNGMQALTDYSIVSSLIEQPAWLDGPGYQPADEILATKNTLVHLPSLVQGRESMVRPTPRFFSSYSLDYDFVENPATPEQWLAFLEKLWPNDPCSIITLQDWFGYLLTPDASQQKILVVIGPKRSGKGTILRILKALIGPSNVVNPRLNMLATPFGLAPLIGKTAAMITDAKLSPKTDQAAIVEALLAISGQDDQTIDIKHRESWSGKLPIRFILAANELPKFKDSGGALAGRMIMLKLKNSFYGKEDTTLTDRLIQELPGILAWAIEGWARLRERGHFLQPDASKDLVEDMENITSPIGKFVREQCEIGEDFLVTCKTLFGDWKDWCESNGESKGDDATESEAAFGRKLRTVLPDVERKQKRFNGPPEWCYFGIKLNPTANAAFISRRQKNTENSHPF